MNVRTTTTQGSTVSGVGRPPRGWVPLYVAWLTFIVGLVLGAATVVMLR